MKKAVFLDRDGVICEERGYLKDIQHLRLIPGAAKALRLLHKHGFKIIVVTNQSGVARGYFSEQFVEQVHREIEKMLSKEGARLDDLYFCPHYPDGKVEPYCIECTCRKPSPGMLLEAGREHGLDLRQSYLVGDKITDLECAYRAGVKGILVLTGYGRDEVKKLDGSYMTNPSFVARDLLEAAGWIIKDLKH